MKKSIFLKSISLIAVVFLALNLSSCSSSSEPNLSVKEKLTSKLWKSQSKIINPSINMSGIVVTDITILESDEVRNYSFKFNTDGSFIVYDILNKNIFQTTWTLSSDETVITLADPVVIPYPFVGNVDMKTITIESITTSKIVSKIPRFLYEGVYYEATITFI